MPNNPFRSPQAPSIASEAISTAVKILDKLNLFKHDDIVAALPFGKAIQGTWKLIKKINDPEKAARHSVGSAVGICFSAGLLEYGIEKLNLSDREEELFKSALEVAKEEAKVDLLTFNPNQIYKTDVAQRFIRIYFQYLSKASTVKKTPIKENINERLERFLQVWLTYYWRVLVEKYRDKYERLDQFLMDKSTRIKQNILQRLNYEASLANMYLSPSQNNPDIRLSDLYIMPRCEILESLSKQGRKSNIGQSKFWDCNNVGLQQDLHGLIHRWLNDSLDTSQLNGDNHRLLLLYGMPGQGKTSFCKRLLYELIGEEQRTNRPVYFLRLNYIPRVDKLRSGPLEYIAQVICELNKITINKADLNHSVLILDGMDELAMSTNLTMSEADVVIQELLNEIRHLDNINIIITSRHGYLQNDRQLTNALVLQIKELEEDQQIGWIKKYQTLQLNSVLSIRAFKKIDQDSALKDLITQPLLLQMVADLDEIPQNTASRAAVYGKLFDHVVSTPWKEKGKNIPALERIGEERSRRLFRHSLQEMAYLMFQKGKDYLPSSIIENDIEPIKKLMHELGQVEGRDTLKTMYISFYFREVGAEKNPGYRNEEEAEYAMEFVHKSFSEFLIAEYIYRRLEEVYLSIDRYDDLRLTDKDKALQAWSELISPRPFSDEILDYLAHIIEDDENTKVKNELKGRLLYFAPHFFENSFLDQEDTTVYRIPPIVRGLESFYAWTIICGNLNYETVLNKDVSYKEWFLYYLSLIVTEKRDIHLQGAFLQNVNFTAFDLGGADFNFANLRRTSFIGTNLVSATFYGADLRDVKFYNADLRLASFEKADLRNADLRKADMSISVLNEADLRKVDFRDVNISGADFIRANLRGANFKGSFIQDVDFNGANLNQANFYKANFDRPGNLTFEQLVTVYSLFQCSGLDSDLQEKLRAARPCLFEKGGCKDDGLTDEEE